MCIVGKVKVEYEAHFIVINLNILTCSFHY